MTNPTTSTMESLGSAEISMIENGAEKRRPDEGVRVYHGQVLDQLPGVAFAAMTLVWVVTSFGHLIW